MKLNEEKYLKKVRRWFVERNLEKATRSPRACGCHMRERGWYSPNTDGEQVTDHVNRLLAKIKEEGFKYKHLKLEDLARGAKKVRKNRDHAFSTGFFSKKELFPNTDKPWDPTDLDKAIDWILDGRSFGWVGQQFGRSGMSIKRQWKVLVDNEKGRGAINYLPVKRKKRTGPFSIMEKKIIERQRVLGLPKEVTMRFLGREWKPEEKSVAVPRMKGVAPSADQLLAHRYLYYCSKHPIISDKEYDELKQEELEYGGASDLLSRPASDRPVDYPSHIRALALYMLFKFQKGQKDPNWDCLPPDFAPKKKG